MVELLSTSFGKLVYHDRRTLRRFRLIAVAADPDVVGEHEARVHEQRAYQLLANSSFFKLKRLAMQHTQVWTQSRGLARIIDRPVVTKKHGPGPG